MEKHAQKHYTVEEYLIYEETSEFKNEYYNGEIFAMSGASIDHNRIITNLTVEFGNFFKNQSCEIFTSDMRLWIEAKKMFTYPDLMIVCDSPAFYPERRDTITNPLIIIEILSESTRNYDRGDKFMFYRSLPSFKEYILVDQYTTHIEHFYIGHDRKWTLIEYNNLNDKLILKQINFQIPLTNIYHNVEFESESAT